MFSFKVELENFINISPLIEGMFLLLIVIGSQVLKRSLGPDIATYWLCCESVKSLCICVIAFISPYLSCKSPSKSLCICMIAFISPYRSYKLPSN